MELRKWGRLPDLEAVIRRFPFACLCMVGLTLLYMIQLQTTDDRAHTAAGLILAGYCSVLWQLFAETRGHVGKPWIMGAKIVTVVVAVTLGVFAKPLAFNVFAAVGASILFLGNAAFWKRAQNDAQVWLFTQKLWTGAIFAFVGSVIYTLGILAIYGALKVLFGIDMEEVMTRLLLPLGLALLAPIYWMGTLPDARIAGDHIEELSFEARALAFLGTWILSPLVLIYGVIILAYALRILLTLSLPSNEIAGLVTPFIAVGTLTWLMLEPDVLREGAFVRFYRRIWYPVAFVAAILLAISIGVRIGAYGLTEERVYLAVFALGTLLVAGLFSLGRDRDIRIPTAAAAGLVLMSAFLAKPLSDLHQKARLTSAMQDLSADGASAQAYGAAIYLERHREAWLYDIFPEAREVKEDELFYWDVFLDARGIRPDPEANEDSYRYALYRQQTPISVRETPIFLARKTISASPEPSERTAAPDQLFWRADTLTLQIDKVTYTIETGKQLQDLYALRVDQSRRYGPNGDRSLGEPPHFDFTLANGQAARVIILEIELSGSKPDSFSGYGEALVFSEE